MFVEYIFGAINFKSWLGHIFIFRIPLVLFWKLGVQC